MDELPVTLPYYGAVRARLPIGTVSFHVRRIVQLNTVFAQSVIICPADDPAESVVALNGLLVGVAVVTHWEWLAADSTDGDCIECLLAAYAST